MTQIAENFQNIVLEDLKVHPELLTGMLFNDDDVSLILKSGERLSVMPICGDMIRIAGEFWKKPERNMPRRKSKDTIENKRFKIYAKPRVVSFK